MLEVLGKVDAGCLVPAVTVVLVEVGPPNRVGAISS